MTDANKSTLIHGPELYQERARAALPLLVELAKAGQHSTYSQLADALRMPNPRNLNYVLGTIGHELKERWGGAVPPIQVLVVNSKTGVPGDGIDGFLGSSSQLTAHERSRIVAEAQNQVHAFNDWDYVLQAIGLESAAESSAKPSPPRAPQQPDEKGFAAIWMRRGQAGFRKALIDAYGSKCAFTGCDVIEALEAAHIVPYSEHRTYAVTNGLLLRSDMHTLFDEHLISIHPKKMSIAINPRLRSSYKSSQLAYRLPLNSHDAPTAEALDQHYTAYNARL